jgi:hypothetical protein
VALYLNTQIEAGAQAVMVFDSWGGVLADGAFQQFSLAYTARVLSQLKTEHNGQRIPSIVFTKGGGLWLPEMAGLNCDVLGLDWTMNLGRARAQVGGQVGGPGKALHHRPHAHLQPGPRHQPIHPARACDGAGRSGAQPFAQAAPARLNTKDFSGHLHLLTRQFFCNHSDFTS